MRKRVLATLCVLCCWSALGFAQSDRVEAIGPAKDSSLSEAIQQSLQPKGNRILLADGTLLAELWLRAELPAAPKKETAGVLYAQFNESEFLGVIHFPEASTDFRGDSVATGFYTLRYGLMPNDGNHMGAAPSRDFLLLIPAKDDPDPKANFEFQKLVALSRASTSSKHPAVLSLVQAEAGPAAAVTHDDEDHYIFSAGVKGTSGEEIPIAVVVKGVAQQQ